MNDEILFPKSSPDAAPLRIPTDLFVKITNVAAQANMEPSELVQLLLLDAFADPDASLDTVRKIVRQMPEEL